MPGKVVRVRGKEAWIEVSGKRRKVNTLLLKKIGIGDYILFHENIAIQKIDEEEAKRIIRLCRCAKQ